MKQSKNFPLNNDSSSEYEDRNLWPPRINIRSSLLTSLFILALLYTLDIASEIIIPITISLLLSLLLSPLVKRLEKLHIPTSISAIFTVLFIITVIITSLYFLAKPASEWMKEAPIAIRKIESKFREIQKPINEIEQAAQSVENITKNSNDANVLKVEIKEISYSDSLLNATPATVANFGIITVLLYFMLASGDSFLRRLVEQMPKFEDKKAAVDTIRTIQKSLSRYLYTISLINIGLGIATTIAMYVLNVPNPILWGVVAALLNFAPYIGPILTVSILALVGLSTFDNLWLAFLPSAIFFVLTVLEGQFITPALAGRNLELSPVAIILTIVILGWLWGVIGVLIAVPILVSFKIICSRIKPLKPISVFLERYTY